MGGGFPAGSIVHIFKTFNVRNISIIERKKQGIKGGKNTLGGSGQNGLSPSKNYHFPYN